MNNKKKILLIDDDPVQIFMYGEEFKENGYDFFSAINEEEAITQIKKEKPDLVLLDLLLGNTYGIDTLKRLKKMEEVKNTKIIIFTNFYKQGIEEECTKNGAAAYLIKFDYLPKEIVKKVAEYIK